MRMRRFVNSEPIHMCTYSLAMQKTLFDFCARSTEERDKMPSVDVESSDVDQDTDSMISEAPVTWLGACCKPGRIDPNQPRTRDVIDVTTKTIHAQKRSVSASWFDRYTWLTLCETKNVLFCHCFVEAHIQRLITFSQKGDDAFVSSVFSRWKNALGVLPSMKPPVYIGRL